MFQWQNWSEIIFSRQKKTLIFYYSFVDVPLVIFMGYAFMIMHPYSFAHVVYSKAINVFLQSSDKHWWPLVKQCSMFKTRERHIRNTHTHEYSVWDVNIEYSRHFLTEFAIGRSFVATNLPCICLYPILEKKEA